MIRTLFLAIVFLICSALVCGQQFIKPYPLSLTTNQTSNIIFPYAIRSIDRGSKEIIARKAVGADNVLQVKAALMDFAATNLSVITADGRLYSFIVDYAVRPKELNIVFGKDADVIFSNDSVNEATLEREAGQVASAGRFLKMKVAVARMGLKLEGIYSGHSATWFCFEIDNHSMVDFRIESIRFFVKDKKRVKRSAEQDLEILPVYKSLEVIVGGGKHQQILIGLRPFTIARTKELVCVIDEHNGVRELEMSINCGSILKDRMIK